MSRSSSFRSRNSKQQDQLLDGERRGSLNSSSMTGRSITAGSISSSSDITGLATQSSTSLLGASEDKDNDKDAINEMSLLHQSHVVMEAAEEDAGLDGTRRKIRLLLPPPQPPADVTAGKPAETILTKSVRPGSSRTISVEEDNNAGLDGTRRKIAFDLLGPPPPQRHTSSTSTSSESSAVAALMSITDGSGCAESVTIPVEEDPGLDGTRRKIKLMLLK